MDSRIAANRRLWNEWARINQESEFYDMAGFRAGQTSLKHIELEEVGEGRFRYALYPRSEYLVNEDRTLSALVDGRVVNRIDLVCVSDADARERAKLLVEVHPIELWEGTRRIERFEPMR